MRHGESKANIEGKIVSHEGNAKSSRYGLTELGQQQVFQAAQNSALTSTTIIYSSDYTRAKETATIMKRALRAKEVHLTRRLRERHFGKWELTNLNNYKAIWQNDSAGKLTAGVESPDKVLDRVTRLVAELEKKYYAKDILLISHGDTLQILECGFQKLNPSQHRSLPHLDVAVVRQLELRV